MRLLESPRSESATSPPTVLAAEAAGVARWTLETATEYAKVREQFGKPIGSFQAIKHMCAEMLLRSEQAAVAVGRRRARPPLTADDDQLSIAAAVAAATGIEAAIANAKDCIQVLGGIGITWEHDAHLYLRRAYGIAQLLGGRQRWLRRIAALTSRRSAPAARASTSSAVDALAAGDRRRRRRRSPRCPVDKRQVALADAGLLAPHWPRPYGRDASPPSSC